LSEIKNPYGEMDQNLSFFTDAVSDDETPDLLLLLFSS
jgi:hypothetical protein